MREEGHKVYEVPFNEDYSFIYFYSFDDLLAKVILHAGVLCLL